MTEAEFNTKYPELIGCYQKDGLYSLGWYLGFTNGDTDAVLDGQFTANDLRAIAAYMDDHKTK